MNDDFELLTDLDPDMNYFSNYITENCQCTNFDSIDDYLTFNSTSLNDNGFLTVFSQNICSFNSHLDDFLILFPENAMPDVFVFSETWHDPLIPILIPGYTGFHTTRQGRRSGGVSIFVKDNFTTSQILELSYADNTIEICSVQIKHDNNKISVCGIYRPHSDTILNFCHSMEQVFDHNLLSSRCILIGDYNINLLSESNEVSHFVDLMRSNHFLQVIDGITRPGVNNQAPSCIDHAWTNVLSGYNCGIVKSGITDHYTLYYTLPFNSCKSNSNKIKIQFRENSESSKILFEEKLGNINWPSIESENLNQFYTNFISTINKLYTECFPLKMKFVSEKYFQNPWHNVSVKKLSAARERYLSLYKLGLVSHADYASYRNRVTTLIRKHKESYFQNLFERNLNNVRVTWKNIRLLCRNKTNKNIEAIVHNGIKYTSDEDISEIFNEFFVNIARNIENSLPHTDLSPYYAVIQNNHPSIEVISATPDEVFDIVQSLKNTKTDIDHIPVSIFKSYSSHFVPSLCKMINMSFQLGMFPDPLKHATVIPVFKKHDAQDVNNYRPISLLPFISKIFEKIIYNRLADYALDCNTFTPCQYGFRKGRSTQDAIIALTQNIYNCFNESDGSFCLNVFVDFRKCFDTINHIILLNKLVMYGINGKFLELIKNYLTNRTQSVRVNNHFSTPKSINIGLPQGSILGPLLCLYMLNDIPNISNDFQAILYADDTTLCFCCQSLNEATILCNTELDKFYGWSVANKLSISPEQNKTYFIVHSYRNFVDEAIDIKMNNVSLGRFEEGNFLGVTIDSKLKYKTHINNVSNKIAKSIGIMRKLSKLKINSKILKQIYYSLVYPHILYNCLSYSGTFNVHLHRIIVLQKRAIRIISGAPYLAHTEPLFALHKILKFEDICRLNVGLYVYDHRESFFPASHNYDTRNSANMQIARSRLTITQNSINVIGPNIWNSIPIEIQNSLTRNSFKYNYKNFLISSYEIPVVMEGRSLVESANIAPVSIY